MTIYEFVNLFGDTSNMVFSIFDFNTQELIVVSNERGEVRDLTDTEVQEYPYCDLEIESMDMWIDNGKIHIELNVSIEDEED